MSPEETYSLEAIQQALAMGMLPQEMGGRVPRQNLLEELSMGLMGMPQEVVSSSDLGFPPQMLEDAITQFPMGDIRTTIQNLYRGPLDTHEPGMQYAPYWGGI